MTQTVMETFKSEMDDIADYCPPSDQQQLITQNNPSLWKKLKEYLRKAFMFLHFLIVMAYLWAGLVEFIRNPPFFDAYGDAVSKTKLPKGIFEDDPRFTRGGVLRLMDLPILAMLLAYVAVCFWLHFEGLSWLLTISISIAFITFWIVNFWGQNEFDWRYYSSRMSGLELQVSTLALTGTVILCVLFYKRRRLPFKLKSSVPVRNMGPVHVIYNICCMFLIIFASLLMWFTKMYISWACFKNHEDLLQICQITTQVQCYSCHECSTEGIKACFKNQTKADQFTCNTQFPETAELGSICIFNYNMSTVQFLTIFAYIGGLCVFLSTFIRLIGHYLLRGTFLLYEYLLKLCNRSSQTLRNHRERLKVARALREARRASIDRPFINPSSPRRLECNASERDVEDGGRARSLSQFSDLSEENHGSNNFLDASCG